MAPLISSCANTCRVYACIRKLYAWSGKKKKKRGWKNRRDTKNRIDIPSDRRFAFPERSTSVTSFRSSAGKSRGKQLERSFKSQIRRKWRNDSRPSCVSLAILAKILLQQKKRKTRLEGVSTFLHPIFLFSVHRPRPTERRNQVFRERNLKEMQSDLGFVIRRNKG